MWDNGPTMNLFFLPFRYSDPERALSSSSSAFDEGIEKYIGLVITPKRDESGRFCRYGKFDIRSEAVPEFQRGM